MLIVEIDVKQKCDACNFDSDKDRVKIQNIKKKRFTLCYNCNKNIEHKDILVTKNVYIKSLSMCEIQ